MRLTTRFSVSGLLALVFTILLTACSKKEAATPTYGVSWTVDGRQYVATSFNQSVSNKELTINAVCASGNDSYSLLLVMPDTVGTFATGNSNIVVEGSYLTKVGGVTSSYQAYFIHGIFGLGTITTVVTSYTPTDVTGTFTFLGSTGRISPLTKEVTNGTFNLQR